jgi:hypothetical protein
MTSDAVFRIVGQIYDAAGDPNAWPVCLASIRALRTAAHLVFHD